MKRSIGWILTTFLILPALSLTVAAQIVVEHDPGRPSKHFTPPINDRSDAELAPPVNDNFGNATILNTVGSMTANNQDATGQTGEPIHGQGAGATQPSENNSIWYKFTAPSSGVLTFGAQNSNPTSLFDSVISAYTGSAVDSLTAIAHSDDHIGGDPHARVTFSVTEGEVYYLAVDGYLNGTGSFILSYAFSVAPRNDHFVDATNIGSYTYGPSLGLTDSNQNATVEAGEPVHDPSLPGVTNSIWYKWTATQPLSMVFRTDQSPADTVLAVYTGSSVNNLTLVARNDNYSSVPGGASRVTFMAFPGVTYHIAIDGNWHEFGNIRLQWEPNRNENGHRFDFDQDWKADLSIFRPSNGQWWLKRSLNGAISGATFGAPTDRIVPADFTGDRKTDIAVWRPSNGTWYILRSDSATVDTVPFGMAGDIPVTGHFDTDLRVDQAVFRPSNGTFYLNRSFSGTAAMQWGANGDVPVIADYDGDGQSDIAIYRPSVGEWWINRSRAGILAFPFGTATDKPVIGDYTGDGRTDVAIWRPSTGEWFVLRSEDWSYYSGPFGLPTDLPVPGDYDGDSKFDIAVFRPSSGTWFIQRSSNAALISGQFGMSGDKPAANAYIP